MILDFAQGIVRHATTTGTPGDPQNFLQTVSSLSDRVDINAPLDQPLVLSVADRDAYYALTITMDGGTINAWGYGGSSSNNAPMVAGQGSGVNKDEFYLYVDVNKATGLFSYGHTKYDPVSGTQPPYATNPQSRPDDQHWFDTIERTMKVWRKFVNPPSSPLTSYGSFVNVVRVFIAKYKIGSGPSAFTSLSDSSPSYLGTQAGLLANSSPNSTYGFRTGALVFDVNGKPFKRSSAGGGNAFFTTEELFTTQLPTSTRIRIESFVVDGIAQANMSAYTIVRFTDFHEIVPLSPNFQDSGLFGIIEEATVVNRLTKVAIDGVITNFMWDWSEVNQPLYVDNAGAIVENPIIADQVPIAFVLDRTTIVLRPARVALAVGEIIGPATETQLGTVTLSYPPSGDPVVIEYNDPLLDALKSGVYTQTYIDSNFYTQTYIDSNLYTQTYIDSNLYTQSELDGSAGSSGAKIDKVVGITGNLVELDANGELVDTGIQASDVLASPLPYDLTYFIAGNPPTDSLLGSIILSRDVTVIGGSPLDAIAYAETAVASSDTTFEIYLNDSMSASGTIVFTAGNSSGIVSISSDISMVKGDRLKLMSGSTVDASLADISVTIPGCAPISTCSL
jgi:hypothetical protein